MDEKDRYRRTALAALVEDTPQAMWQRLQDYARRTYSEAYASVSADPELLDDQRPHKLFQERYFKMEHAVVTIANSAGVSASAKLIGDNTCYYAYAARGRIGFTQSYVKVYGARPTPAAFRKQLAEVAAFQCTSRLDLGDEPGELLTPKQINGILLHSPVGRKFSDDDQKLGAIGFTCPIKITRVGPWS